MDEEIGCEHNDKSGYFYIKIDDMLQAKMTFVFNENNKIVIYHTEVNPRNKGKGFGRKMIRKAVEFARENKTKILPVCPYTKNIMRETPEFKDVL